MKPNTRALFEAFERESYSPIPKRPRNEYSTTRPHTYLLPTMAIDSLVQPLKRPASTDEPPKNFPFSRMNEELNTAERTCEKTPEASLPISTISPPQSTPNTSHPRTFSTSYESFLRGNACESTTLTSVQQSTKEAMPKSVDFADLEENDSDEDALDFAASRAPIAAYNITNNNITPIAPETQTTSAENCTDQRASVRDLKPKYLSLERSEEKSKRRTAYFYLRYTQTFHHVLSVYDYEFGTKTRAYRIYFKGTPLKGDETPKSLGLRGDKELFAVPCKREDSFFSSSDDEIEVAKKFGIRRRHSYLRSHIKFFIRLENGRKRSFKQKFNVSLKNSFEAFAKSTGKVMTAYRFLLDGRRVSPYDSPRLLSLRQNDTIDAMMPMMGGEGIVYT